MAKLILTNTELYKLFRKYLLVDFRLRGNDEKPKLEKIFDLVQVVQNVCPIAHCRAWRGKLLCKAAKRLDPAPKLELFR